MRPINSSILETIGNTPIVELKNVTKNSPHKFFGKVEYFNPAGSIKDRIAVSLIESAEKRGTLKPGGTIIEATAGNTGLGLALVAAVKGYRCIFVMPSKISEEKRAFLRAYGAKVVIAPTGVDHHDPSSYISVAEELARRTPNCLYTNQYENLDNVAQHYKVTGPEVWEQMKGDIDVFVAGSGTGGTVSGVGHYLREKNPNVQIVSPDPVGSILFDLFYSKKIVDDPAPYKVEGVGQDMLPGNTQMEHITAFEKVTDKEAFMMTRRLIKEEALCVGPSAALNLVGAMKFAEKLKKPSKILVIFPDSGRSYLSKVFNDQWMVENGFLSAEELKSAFNNEIGYEEMLATWKG